MKLFALITALLLLMNLAACAKTSGGGLVTVDPPASSTQTVPSASEDDRALAPDFTVYDLEGNPVKLSDFRGKPVVLNFWASWCGPCRGEMPDFDEAYAAYGQQIHFLMVNLTDGTRETTDSVSQFILDTGYRFPVYCDTGSEAASAYGIYSIPTTYFIDSQGYVVAYGSGALDKATLEKGIDMIYTP